MRATVLVVLAAATVASQSPSMRWQLSDGPYDGSPHQLLQHPSGALFAITTNGLRRSTDDGRTWTVCSDAQGERIVNLVDGRLFVGPSPTGQVSWVDAQCRTVGTATLPADFNFPKSIHALAVSDTGRVIASRLGVGLLWSDAGREWRKAATPRHDTQAISAIVPVRPRQLVAIAADVLVSNDDGESWTALAKPTWIESIIRTPDGALLAGGDGVWYSADGARTWRRAGLDGKAIAAVAAGPRNSKRWFAAVREPYSLDAQVHTTLDGGQSWQPLLPTVRRLTALAVSARGTVLAGGADGLFRAGQDERRWQFHGVSRAALRHIISGPDATVIAGSPELWISRDSGASWTRRLLYLNEGDREADSGTSPRAFAIANDRLLAGSQNGVAVSSDWGSTWTRSGLWQTTEAIVERPDGTIWAASYSGGAFRSDDGGMKWTDELVGLTNFSLRGLAVLVNGDLIAVSPRDAFLKTGTRPWRPISTGLPRGRDYPVHVAQGRSSIGVLATSNQLHEWNPATNTWTPALVVTTPITAMAWDESGRLWLGTASGVNVAVRDERGWRAHRAGLDGSAVQALAFSAGKHVIATTNQGTYLGRLDSLRLR
jgi:hypothetical protein